MCVCVLVCWFLCVLQGHSTGITASKNAEIYYWMLDVERGDIQEEEEDEEEEEEEA